MIPPKTLIEFLRNSDNFLITTHISPDGDGLGSANALSMLLTLMGKKNLIIIKDPPPKQYLFLPKISNFQSLDNLSLPHWRPENLILVDCNSIQRTGLENFVNSYTLKKIAIIDHHETTKKFDDLAWIVPQAPATGILIYYLCKHLKISLSYEIAVNLYTAISFDTGNFRYENTDSEVFKVTAELVEAGVKPYLVYSSLFEKWGVHRFKLLVEVLKSLKINNGIAIGVITKQMFQDTLANEDDTESFVSFPRIIDGVKISVMITEIEENYFRVSLRASKNFDVAQVAREFGGGGHKNAAGFRIKKDLETLKKELTQRLIVML
ncbi:MAG: bifunctional oligoribonuclease/PAP phosphatase NrnA [Thermodesulfovibrionales bacterium]|nr:bifunctional oligoribonuclease/PAP phosphatase NrnA [Thermodesulfovibrionales bacterium]